MGALSPWHGKKHTSVGLSVLEVLLGVFLLGILLAAFASAYQHKSQKKNMQTCVERKWHWLAALDEIEFHLRKWEMLAGPCLWLGFNPVVQQTENQTVQWTVESARPLLRPTKFQEILEVPALHRFTSGHQILVCDEHNYRQGVIRRTHQTGGNDLAALNVTWEESKKNIYFSKGAVVVAMKERSYEVGPGEMDEKQILYTRWASQRKKRLSSRFDHFDFRQSFGDIQKGLHVHLAIGSQDCLLEREFLIKGTRVSGESGRWFLTESAIFHKPWQEEDKAVTP